MTRPIAILCSLLALAPACDTSGSDDELLELGAGDYTKGGAFGKADASVQAVIVDMEFEGSVIATSSFSARSTIDTQLLYTIGHLNGDNSVGRLDQADIEITSTESAGNGRVRVHYTAKLPVAWGKKNAVPQTYELRLPLDATFEGQESFTSKYSTKCVDFGAHEVEAGNMWYYYRPRRSGCSIAETDIVRATATVSVSDVNTTGKYPEYDKVWEDDVLQVVAVFGKYEDFATSSSDAGISAYNQFHRAIQQQLAPFGVAMEPANVGTSPGVANPDITYTAELPDGKSIEVHALLVDNVRTAGATFDARYAELSTRADFIAYSGHAGLGANIRALARKGEWTQGQYVIVFQNGCDTYAYVDSALWDAHSDVNSDDPTGTKYVDILNNAMPSFFNEMPNGSMAIIRGLLSFDDPKTYEQIMTSIDSDEVVLVTGEQDNAFVPGGGGGGGGGEEGWDGLDEEGTVAKNQEVRFQTPTLAAGRYVFEMTGTADADLYVRTGAAPTEQTFECRPFKSGSTEACSVQLAAPAPIHVMVRGWASSSTFELVGRRG